MNGGVYGCSQRIEGKEGTGPPAEATRYSLAGYKAAWQDEEAFRQICLLAVIGLPLACWLGRDWAESVLLLSLIHI